MHTACVCVCVNKRETKASEAGERQTSNIVDYGRMEYVSIFVHTLHTFNAVDRS